MKEELGRQKPKTIGEMMEIANGWDDGEESVRGDRARSPKNDDDHNERRGKQRRTHERDSEFVAAKFFKGGEGGYHGNRDWKPRPEEKPISQQLDEYCTIHAYRDKETGRLKANHIVGNCRKMQEIGRAHV